MDQEQQEQATLRDACARLSAHAVLSGEFESARFWALRFDEHSKAAGDDAEKWNNTTAILDQMARWKAEADSERAKVLARIAVLEESAKRTERGSAG